VLVNEVNLLLSICMCVCCWHL